MRHIKDYVQPHLVEENPDNVIILGGGNDLPVTQVEHSPVPRIVADIIATGNRCKDNGATTEAIAGIPSRQPAYFQLYRRKLNELLQVECERNGFDFINNDNIVLSDHLLRDGVHLNSSGSDLLSKNFSNYFNSIC